MRISDWSSDVCSSDLSRQPLLSYAPVQRVAAGEKLLGAHRGEPRGCAAPVHRLGARARADAPAGDQQTDPGAVSAPPVPLSQGEWRAALDAQPACTHNADPDRKSTRLNSSH